MRTTTLRIIIKKRILLGITSLYSAGALHVIIGSFASKFVVFFGSIFVVRLLSKEDYGVLKYVENIYSYALLAAGLGLANAILRYLVISEDVSEKKGHYTYITRKSFIIDIIIALFLCAYSFSVEFPDKYASARYLIPILALLLPAQDLLAEELYTARAFFKNKLYAYASFITSTLLIFGRIVGAHVGGVSGVLWSRTLLNMVFALIGSIVVWKTFFSGNINKPLALTQERKKEVNAYAFQYMITNGFWALFMLNDTQLLGRLLNDPSVLADYGVAYVFPGNVSIFATAIGIFVAPYFTKNEKNTEWVRRNYKRVYMVSMMVVGVVVSMIALIARPLILWVYGEQYLNVVGLMRVLLIAAFINSGLRFTTANLLAAMGQIKYNMIISGFGIVTQLILDFLLIPKWGGMGVAISNCAVYLAMAVSLFIIFYRKYYKQ